MEARLQNYIDSLFQGAPHTIAIAELREEILQNTLDRYHDLRAEGKTEEEAYRIAVSGIGNIDTLLNENGYRPIGNQPPVYNNGYRQYDNSEEAQTKEKKRTVLVAIGVLLCILSISPPIALSHSSVGDTLGPILMFAMIAVAVFLFIYSNSFKSSVDYNNNSYNKYNQKPLIRSIRAVISTLCLVLYFVISFSTNAWHLTWLIFPICACLNGIVGACFDLRK